MSQLGSGGCKAGDGSLSDPEVLIVGAGLFSRSESSFKVLGYSGIPMLMFIAAVLSPIVLWVTATGL